MSRPGGLTAPVAGATVTAAAAVSCLGASGLLPLPATAAAVLVTVLSGSALLLWPAGSPAARRRTLGQPAVAVAVIIGALLLLVRLREAAGDPAALADGVATGLTYPLVAVLIGQLFIVTSQRDLAMSLVASCLCILLALGTSPRTETPDLSSGFGLVLGLAWACGLWTVWLLHRLRERTIPTYVVPGRGSSPQGPIPLIAVSLLLALAALLIPPPAGARPSDPVGDSASAAGLAGASTTRGAQNYLSSSMDLNTRGELSDRPLLLIPADSPPLWGSTELVTYDGRSWGAAPGSLQARSYAPRDATGAWDLRPGADDGAPAQAADRSDVLRVLAPDISLPVLAPGQAVSIEVAGPVLRLGRTMSYPVAQPVSGYTVQSTTAIVAPVGSEDTALPHTVPDRVVALARRLTADADTVGAKVAAIEAHLHATTRYRLDSPVPGPGEDAVDHFLFESQEGFCEQYAAAEVVLLRAVGVPARLVTGFSGGAPRDGDPVSRVVRERDAHAWVQVNTGADQWVWTDPTAEATLAEEQGAEAEAFLDWLKKHALLVTAVLAGVLLLVIAELLAARRVRARRAAARAAAAPLAVRVLVAFAALEKALDGSPLARAHTDSVAELRGTLRSRWPNGLPEADRVNSALEVVQQILYDRGPVADVAAREALDTLRTLTEQVSELLSSRRKDRVTALVRRLVPSAP